MKRDWNVIKEILIQIEANNLSDYIKNKEYVAIVENPNDFLGHVEILLDANVIKNAKISRQSDGKIVFWDLRGVYITMQGHDLLDALRDQNVWNRVVKKSLSASVSLSWEFIKQAIPFAIKEILES